MLTIGQLAKRAGLRSSTLRYYEDEGLLAPTGRSDAGYRLYDEAAEQRLRFIQRAQRLGFALGDIRTLLDQLGGDGLRQDEIIKRAEERYLAIEKQLTQWLVVRYEMALFLQDLHQRSKETSGDSADYLFEQLIERVCSNPGAQSATESATTMLDWLLHKTDCHLSSSEGKRLLEILRGQHIHVWKEGDEYHILVVSSDEKVGAAIAALAQLEAGCSVHQQTYQNPELMHNDEGYLLISRGDNAFLMARIFLSIAA